MRVRTFGQDSCESVLSVDAGGGWKHAYQIPAGTGLGLDGVYIVWHVTDGGSPGAGNDTAGFAVAPDLATANDYCNGTVVPTFSFYDIVAGNLVVH